MAEWMGQYLWLIPLLPLLAAVTGAVDIALRGERGEHAEGGSYRLSSLAVQTTLLLLLIVDGYALLYGPPGRVLFGEWSIGPGIILHLAYQLDPLALSAATLVTSLVLLVLRYCRHYMHREDSYQHLNILLVSLLAGLLLLVLAENLVLLLLGWELSALCALLLSVLGSGYRSGRGSLLPLHTLQRLAGAALLLAVVAALSGFVESGWAVLSAPSSNALNDGWLIACCAAVAVAIRAGAFPATPWVAGTMTGTTPINGLLYGSLMGYSALYLLLRLGPLLQHYPSVSVLLLVVGVATLLYGTLTAQIGSDVRNATFSGCTAQTGLILIECAAGWYPLASWRMGAVAVWGLAQMIHLPELEQLRTEGREGDRLRRNRSHWIYALTQQQFYVVAITRRYLIGPLDYSARLLRSLLQRTQYTIETVTQPQGLSSGGIGGGGHWWLLLLLTVVLLSGVLMSTTEGMGTMEPLAFSTLGLAAALALLGSLAAFGEASLLRFACFLTLSQMALMAMGDGSGTALGVTGGHIMPIATLITIGLLLLIRWAQQRTIHARIVANGDSSVDPGVPSRSPILILGLLILCGGLPGGLAAVGQLQILLGLYAEMPLAALITLLSIVLLSVALLRVWCRTEACLANSKQAPPSTAGGRDPHGLLLATLLVIIVIFGLNPALSSEWFTPWGALPTIGNH